MSRKVLYCLMGTTLYAACAPLHATMHAPSPVVSTPSYGKDATNDVSIKTQKGGNVSPKDRTVRQRPTTAHKKPPAKDATRIQQLFGALCVLVVGGLLYWYLSTDENKPALLGGKPLEEKKDLDDIPYGFLPKDLRQGGTTSQVKIEDLQARTSNIANLDRAHAQEVRDYLDAFVQLLRRGALGSPADKAHLYRMKGANPTVESTEEQRKKIIAQLTQEAANDTPVYFHATTLETFEAIAKQGLLLPTYSTYAPGAFVSTNYETQYGPYVFGFRRKLEQSGVPVCYAANLATERLRTRGYWIAFYEPIRIWEYLAKVYVNTSMTSSQNIAYVRNLLAEQQKKIEAQLATQLPAAERVYLQKLKHNIARIEVVPLEGKDTVPSNTIIPRGYIMDTYMQGEGAVWMLTTHEDEQPVFEPTSYRKRDQRVTTKMNNGQEKDTYGIRDPYGHRMIARQKEGKGTYFLEPLEG